MKNTLPVILLVSMLVWPVYSVGQRFKSNAHTEIIDGVEFIHNTETPLHPEKTVSFVEDLSLSGEDQDGNIILFDPILFLVDDDENIYIGERQDQVIKVFDSDGKYIMTIGAKGQGPGEFQMITYLVFTKDGELAVLDQMARRTNLFNSSGQFLKSFKWKTGYYQFILMKSSSYIISEIVYGGDRQFRWLYVKEIDFGGKEIQSYGNFTLSKPLIVRDGSGTYYSSLPVSRRSIFKGDQKKDLFYHCVNNTYIIEVYDITGKLLRKIDRPYEPVPFTKKDAEEYRARFNYHKSGAVKKAVKDMKMPKVKNIVSRMYIDDKSNLWILTNETKEKDDKILTAFDIFNSDGNYYAKVWTEFTSFIFKKGKMYRMAIDQNTGYQTLKRYKVVWN